VKPINVFRWFAIVNGITIVFSTKEHAIAASDNGSILGAELLFTYWDD